jgi:tRNA A-37 threonylcarbamoyl transferase component Bud32
MRLLLIEEDKRRCADFRQRLAAWRPQAELVVRDPVAQGPLPREFLAQGYDAVLLSDEWSGGGGLAWAKELAGRSGFAPLVLLSGSDSAAYEAIPFGVQVVDRDDPHPGKLLEVLSAAEQRQSFARAVWRTSTNGRESQRFGDAFIRGYRHIRRISAGVVSDLYLGESESAGELVALKVARDRQTEHSDLDDSFRRFLQEYEIVQRIRSPGIVRLYDLGVSDEYAWLVMEFFAAGDLRTRIRSGSLSVRRAIYTAISIARALQAIHAAGVLHRDLKPGNVMIRDDGSIALIDFGLSKDAALARDVTDHGMIFGTPHYMSPEQGHGESIDGRSDLYSLGVILFEMLVREKPFRAENPMALIYKHRKEPVPRLPAAFDLLQPIVDRLLAKTPDERYADAGEAATAMEGAFRQMLKSEVETL